MQGGTETASVLLSFCAAVGSNSRCEFHGDLQHSTAEVGGRLAAGPRSVQGRFRQVVSKVQGSCGESLLRLRAVT